MKQQVVIIKYNAGNIGSVSNALRRIGINPIISADAQVIKRADKVIFPGVGEASTTMLHLTKSGLDQVIVSLKQPVLGICLGMQLMCQHSEEGDTSGMGIFSEKVKRFQIDEKIPHMGWNELKKDDNRLFDNLPDAAWFYFVHSYYAVPGSNTIASSFHGIEFGACLHYENFYAVQFHPEKSGKIGQQLLNNFINL